MWWRLCRLQLWQMGRLVGGITKNEVTWGQWSAGMHHPVVGVPLSWWTYRSVSLWWCSFVPVLTSYLIWKNMACRTFGESNLKWIDRLRHSLERHLPRQNLRNGLQIRCQQCDWSGYLQRHHPVPDVRGMSVGCSNVALHGKQRTVASASPPEITGTNRNCARTYDHRRSDH